MKKRLLWTLSVALEACTCGSRAPLSPTASAAPTSRVVDLKGALISMVPETRGLRIQSASVHLQRSLASTEAQRQQLQAQAEKSGFVFLGDSGQRGRNHLRLGPQTLDLHWELNDADVGKIFASPLPPTSQQLSSLIPVLPGLPFASERLEIQLEYQASPERVDFLLRQAISLNLRGGWSWNPSPGGDAGLLDFSFPRSGPALPDSFTAGLRHSGHVQSLRFVRRDPQTVSVRLETPLQ